MEKAFSKAIAAIAEVRCQIAEVKPIGSHRIAELIGFLLLQSDIRLLQSGSPTSYF